MECLVQLVSKEPDIVQDNETVLLACDTVLNFLLKVRREHHNQIFIQDFTLKVLICGFFFDLACPLEGAHRSSAG